MATATPSPDASPNPNALKLDLNVLLPAMVNFSSVADAEAAGQPFAAAVLATARALGEAIMLSMVSGSKGFAPNPIDGITFLLEPTRPLAATIVDNREGLSAVPLGQTIYAFAAVLLISSVFLSFAGWYMKRRLRHVAIYGGAG